MLNVDDEFTRECLAIKVARKLKAIDVIETLADLFITRGVPDHIRSDQGPEFVAKAVQGWIAAVGAQTAYIERGSRGRTGMWRASTASSGTSFWRARSSTACEKPRCSSRLGGATTTQPGRTRPWATDPLRPRSSYGGLRHPDPLRRPPQPSSTARCTNIPLGSPNGGWSESPWQVRPPSRRRWAVSPRWPPISTQGSEWWVELMGHPLLGPSIDPNASYRSYRPRMAFRSDQSGDACGQFGASERLPQTWQVRGDLVGVGVAGDDEHA